jgi:hypothetical protein
MLYLEVLPMFALYTLALGAVTLTTRLTQAGKPLYPFMWHILVASALGVLTADALLWSVIATAGGLLTATNASAQARQLVGILAPLGPVLRPIPMSLLGAGAGIAFGLIWTVFVTRENK